MPASLWFHGVALTLSAVYSGLHAYCRSLVLTHRDYVMFRSDCSAKLTSLLLSGVSLA